MNNKKIATLALVFLVLLGAMAAVYLLTRPETTAGEKSFTLTVVHKDGTEKVMQLKSTQEYLGAALTEMGIIIPSDSPGLYDTVDGETADFSVDKGFWSFKIDGADALEGMDTTPITEGGNYSLIYTIFDGSYAG